MRRFRDARQSEELNHLCETCGSNSPTSLPGCEKCSDDTAFPAVAEIMRDIPEDDEGEKEEEAMQRLMRVHKNLGHPSNRLLAQILKEAKAPASIVELASKIQCPICARHVRTSPARPGNPPGKRARTSSYYGLQLPHYSQQRETDDTPLR